jgi:S-(hydroxymethyl)glutathione dehydrogenase/alcohol dehydrogenase
MEQPGDWQVVTVDLEDPKEGEVLVRISHSGLCHSDDHAATGDLPASLPRNGGHEGSGIVEALGAGVRGLEVGDHIVTSFVPSCGSCRWCASGIQNLCDAGAAFATGTMLDGSFRMFLDGRGVAKSGALGTFAEYNVFPAMSCVKIPRDVPLDVACLLGCGVPTGWGAAVRGGEVQPGDVVLVMGIGGLGANAVQGARSAGARRVIAVDTAASKEAAARRLGASDFFDDMDEATELARSLTNGQGADSAVITIGVLTSESIEQAFRAIRKAGTVVVASLGRFDAIGIPVNLFELAMYQKRIQGVLYGMGSPRREIHRMIDLYRDGVLKLDELITRRYPLSEINQGYRDMAEGLNIRGVIEFAS